jgi:hypothetical protein
MLILQLLLGLSRLRISTNCVKRANNDHNANVTQAQVMNFIIDERARITLGRSSKTRFDPI